MFLNTYSLSSPYPFNLPGELLYSYSLLLQKLLCYTIYSHIIYIYRDRLPYMHPYTKHYTPKRTIFLDFFLTCRLVHFINEKATF